tara:strand:+ start:672 stop:917 length:246 start_codon:yes stop_codon:yes gene_type:complete
MSYDFRRNHHIGMTPEGYHANYGLAKGASKQKAKRPKQISQHIDTWLIHLENLMLDGDVEAKLTLKAFYDRKYNARYLKNN